jgi:uncharacterized OsmC-like protein
MIVEYAGGMKLVARHRDLEFATDLPESSGGADTAMTPTEVFIASLAACVGVYVLSFARRRDVALEGLRIEADWEIADGPRRVARIRIEVRMPGAVSERERAALQRVAEQCLVHNTLHHTPDIAITIA